jgi:hypothetical protein
MSKAFLLLGSISTYSDVQVFRSTELKTLDIGGESIADIP